MKKLLLIDGNSLACRGYYAIKNTINGLVYNKDKVPISVCQIFLSSLKKLIKEQSPSHIAICFDPGGSNWRHVLYPDYKKSREHDDDYEDFQIDLRNLKLILKEQGFTLVCVAGNEADDAIASLVFQLKQAELEIVISSSDKDLLQLVNSSLNVSMIYKKGLTNVKYTESLVFEEFGVRADQIADYKALAGDKSDDIPGVKGIGKIYACNLLETYQTVEEIAQKVDELKKSFKTKIEPEIERMLLFKQLTTLRTDLRIPIQLECLDIKSINSESAIAAELGLS